MSVKFPGTPSLLFLAIVLVLIPLAARRTAHRLRKESPGKPVSRLTYWRSAVVFQLLLLLLAWWTGASFDYPMFAVAAVTVKDVLFAVAALAACLGLRLASRWTRSEEELKALSVYERAPRTRAEVAWFCAAVVAASIAEEATNRGVGMSILWYSLGIPWIAALLMSIAFALAHWNQGWKSGLTIFAFAGIFHALVYTTETLVFAMLVHAAYDFIAGAEIRKKARKYDLERPATECNPSSLP